MAKTRERKLEVARAIHTIVTEEYGLHPESLIFDALTFTLATGDPEFNESAIETIEGIRLIEQELPGVLTHPRRLQCLLRPVPGRAPGAQRDLPLPLRQGRAGHGHHPSLARGSARRNPGRGAGTGRGFDLLPPAGRAPALHRALRGPDRNRRDQRGRRHGRYGRLRAAALPHRLPQERGRRGRYRRGDRHPRRCGRGAERECCCPR